MIIRQLKKEKAVKNFKNLLGFMAFVFIVAAVIVFQKNIKSGISDITKSNLKSGEANIEGKLIDTNNYPKYTHTILTNEKKEIGVKSNNINLNNYIGKIVNAIGEYDPKTQNVIIIDTLKLPKDRMIVNGNNYTIVSNLVIFKFLDQNEIKVNLTTDNSISIKVYDNIVTTVQRFSCRKILKGQSCETLIKEYESKEKETFDSIKGYKFYKHADKYRLTFDNNYGYIFKDISDENMLNLSNSFQIINENFMIENKMAEIEENCKDESDRSRNIDKFDMQIGSSNDILTLILNVQTEKGKNAKCSLTFDIRNDRKITKRNFVIN